MKKYLISIPEALACKIDEAIKDWGFANRTEFFRFAALEFLRDEDTLMPSDETLKEHTRAIKIVKNRQDKVKTERDWVRNNRYLPNE